MKRFIKHIATILLVFLVISGIFAIYNNPSEEEAEIPLNEVAQKINDKQVASIIVSQNKLKIELKNGEKVTSQKEPESGLAESLSNYGVTEEGLRGVKLSIKENAGASFVLKTLLPIFIPLFLSEPFYGL